MMSLMQTVGSLLEIFTPIPSNGNDKHFDIAFVMKLIDILDFRPGKAGGWVSFSICLHHGDASPKVQTITLSSAYFGKG